MFYASGTPDHPKSYARYDVIADDGQGTCTVRNGGGVEYPVASYLIDQMAEPAEGTPIEPNATAPRVCGTCDGRMFTFNGEDCPTCHATGAQPPDILTNGSKWSGEQQDDFETLIATINATEYILDPHFDLYGNGQIGGGFIAIDKNWPSEEGRVTAFGNFQNLSHVFNLKGTVEQMKPLINAIAEHCASDRYRTEFMRLYGSLESFEVQRVESQREKYVAKGTLLSQG
jgi:hypothetical protein